MQDGSQHSPKRTQDCLFKRFILHLSHLCPPAGNSPKCAAPPARCPSLVSPKRHLAADYNPVVTFILSCTIRSCRRAVALLMWQQGGGSKWFLVHMNNALLYCAIVNLYSYCNVYRKILEGYLVFKKQACLAIKWMFC